MAIPLNKELYEKAKLIADETYDKPSAYKSGFIVKTYKKMGGKYKDDINKEKDLKRWYEEGWTDINPLKTESSYPVYRPTKRINKNTPLTVDEIDPNNLLEQSIIKQVIRGKKNLKPFKEIKGSGVPLAFGDYKIDPYAYKQAKKLNITIKPSTKKYKKLDIYDKNNNYLMSVGDTRYNDYRSYIKEKGIEYADTRRRLYKIRHQRNRLKEGTASFYADQLLW